MSPIPQTGNFDEFLWTSEKYNSSYRIRNKKYGTYLMLSANPLIPSLGPISTLNTQFWNFTSANVSIYGTNAYNISNQSNNMVLTNQSSSAVLAASLK